MMPSVMRHHHSSGYLDVVVPKWHWAEKVVSLYRGSPQNLGPIWVHLLPKTMLKRRTSHRTRLDGPTR
jgi:hypothetical protein